MSLISDASKNQGVCVEARQGTLRLSILDVALDLGDLSDDTAISGWTFGYPESQIEDKPEAATIVNNSTKAAERKNAKSIPAIIWSLNRNATFRRFKKSPVDALNQSAGRGTTGLKTCIDFAQKAKPNAFLRRVKTLGKADKAQNGVADVSEVPQTRKDLQSDLVEKSSPENSNPLRKSLKMLSTFPPLGKISLPKMYHPSRSTASSHADIDSTPSLPPTPFILMTQLEMGGIGSASDCASSGDSSYLVVSQDNAVLDVLPLNEVEAVPAPSKLALRRCKTTLPRPLRTFLPKRQIAIAHVPATRASSESFCAVGDDAEVAATEYAPANPTLSRGRDLPFPVHPRQSLLGRSVHATGSLGLCMGESDTDSLSVYSDDVSIEM